MNEQSMKQTEDVFKFATFLFKGLSSARKNDGSISAAEVLTLLVQSFPLGFEAYKDYAKIKGEMTDMTPEQMQKLAVMGVELAQAIFELLVMSPAMAEMLEPKKEGVV